MFTARKHYLNEDGIALSTDCYPDRSSTCQSTIDKAKSTEYMGIWQEHFLKNYLVFSFSPKKQKYIFNWGGDGIKFEVDFVPRNSMLVNGRIKDKHYNNRILFGTKLDGDFPSEKLKDNIACYEVWNYTLYKEKELYSIFGAVSERYDWWIFHENCSRIQNLINYNLSSLEEFYNSLLTNDELLRKIKENKKFLIKILSDFEKTDLFRVCEEVTKQMA